MAHYDWQLATQPEAEQITQVATDLKVPPFLARLLIQRGITTQEAFEGYVNPDLSRLHDPFLLHDMANAVSRIQQAIEQQEKITIYGDYDVDGLTATSIMQETLQSMGAEPMVFIPDRFTDGYGPNAAVYRYLQSSGTQLVITVDNGVAGADVIDAAMAAGMDVVVTDHHELPEVLPQAVAVVHPRHPEGAYPFGDLSGAGVAFKVATALLGAAPVESIDLAAMGTVADLVGLTDENRIIVQMGLAMIRTQPRAGIAALLAVAKVDPATVDEATIGFALGPRLNALGRLGDATPGVTLLTTFDDEEAAVLAANVNDLNTKRQALVQTIADEALALAHTPENAARRTLILAHQGWHEGVLGIVASRIVEATGKPTLVLNISKDGDSAKGSGRSVDAYHLFNALDAVRDEMTHFGGHHMACGLTVPTANIPALEAAMEAAAAVSLKETPKPVLAIAARLSPAELTMANYTLLRQLAPFGSGNPEPTFSLRPETLGDVKPIGKTGAHLRFQADGNPVIAFGYGDQAAALSEASQVKLAVRLDANTWQGRTSLQLRLADWQLQAPAVIDLRLPRPSAEQFRGAFTYVFFDARVQAQLTRQFQFGGPVVAAKDLTSATHDVVLVDLPPDEATLTAVMVHVARPVRVVFTADPAALVALPTRQECGQVLHFLTAHPDFDKHHLPALAKAVHLTTTQAIFAVQVFFELGFVTIEGALIRVAPAPTKQPLTNAVAYQKRVAFLALAKTLQTAARPALEQVLTATRM
ncbi:single-stranded-DNA-specific exonuclease RecJ [Lacticaseibacillus daqingensis]|uniref:single-stranded-DNA-specific exonuclease RecJ n=1 Tax=Lacticaseibacillus daqingensis TaxID=2486014 RepID=UPI000F7B8D0E|nr:single-stranded-DNA-specific exonuclease RecJ [Lacticaseibacillus daqingensis]